MSRRFRRRKSAPASYVAIENQPQESFPRDTCDFSTEGRRPFMHPSSPRRWLLAAAGLFTLVYAFAVLIYVQVVPDLGLRTIFTTELLKRPTDFDPGGNEFQLRDRIVRIGPV